MAAKQDGVMFIENEKTLKLEVLFTYVGSSISSS